MPRKQISIPAYALDDYKHLTKEERKKYAERLTKLAELLEQSKKDVIELENGEHIHFDMSTWGETEPNVCGTTACAAGLAASHPWFTRRGFRLEAQRAYDRDDEEYRVYYDVSYRGQTSTEACLDFFGSDFPFSADWIGAASATARDVAQILRRMIHEIERM